MVPITVYGGGSWGTTLAIHLGLQGKAVALWEWDGVQRERMTQERENRKFLPGIPFPGFIHVVREEAPPAPEGEIAILAVPSHGVRALMERLTGSGPATLWVSATKGLEADTCLRMSQVLETVGAIPSERIVVLAGPSLAREVSEGKPAVLLSASTSPESARQVQELFATDRFRVYTSADPVGVELATSLKNVIALAAGIADGLGLGNNARGALLTRGLAEITRLGVALGAKVETFLGLAGVGDLVTTCTSPLSRNHTLGEALGRGVPLEKALAGMSMVAEGVRTTQAALRLAERAGVEVPISREIGRILFEGRDPSRALQELMTRPLRAE